MADVRRAPEKRESHEDDGQFTVPSARREGYPTPNHTGPLSLSGQHRAVNPTGPSAARGFRTLLRNKLFLRLWMAQLISQTINNAANYAMIVLVTKESDSALATSGAIVAFSLPALFIGAPAGVLVDRFDRRLVLWVSNVLRAMAMVVFIFGLIVAPNSVWPVYALTFFIAMVGQFFTPAEGAAIPRLVHRGELMNALALFNITFTISQALGLIIIGPLVLLTKGLPEYEASPDGLRLTLLRCVGTISCPAGLATRPLAAGPDIATPDGQCRGRHVFEYALRLDGSKLSDSALVRASQDYRTDFLRGDPFEPPLELGGDVVFSCLKQAEDGSGLILRVFNPNPQPEALTLSLPARRIRLDEEEDVDGGLDLAPGEIATLLLPK